MLYSLLLNQIIRTGHLIVIDANQQSHNFGKPGTGPEAVIRLHDKNLHWKLLVNSPLYLGEAYMDGTLTLENGTTLRQLLRLFAINMVSNEDSIIAPFLDLIAPIRRFFLQFNPPGRSLKNVAHHYNIDYKLYQLFLDEDLIYTCSYFRTGQENLERSQLEKKAHIVAKLNLQPGMKVLDLGCGWGGLALYMAQVADCEVTGITLSTEQLKIAQERAKKAGLEHKVRFFLRDYRHETGHYDRITAIGILEHIGVPQYRTFFRKIKDLLTPQGVALVHSIGRPDGPGTTNPWFRKYLFPGGYAPALSEVLPIVEDLFLWVTDIEILRLHYAKTLEHWGERFMRNWDEAARIYDERFCRMWEFYLYAAEMEFLYLGTMVFHIQLTKTIDALPITRDYMFERETALLERK